jgi:hypothetical protein
MRKNGPSDDDRAQLMNLLDRRVGNSIQRLSCIRLATVVGIAMVRTRHLTLFAAGHLGVLR